VSRELLGAILRSSGSYRCCSCAARRRRRTNASIVRSFLTHALSSAVRSLLTAVALPLLRAGAVASAFRASRTDLLTQPALPLPFLVGSPRAWPRRTPALALVPAAAGRVCAGAVTRYRRTSAIALGFLVGLGEQAAARRRYPQHSRRARAAGRAERDATWLARRDSCGLRRGPLRGAWAHGTRSRSADRRRLDEARAARVGRRGLSAVLMRSGRCRLSAVAAISLLRGSTAAGSSLNPSLSIFPARSYWSFHALLSSICFPLPPCLLPYTLSPLAFVAHVALARFSYDTSSWRVHRRASSPAPELDDLYRIRGTRSPPRRSVRALDHDVQPCSCERFVVAVGTKRSASSSPASIRRPRIQVGRSCAGWRTLKKIDLRIRMGGSARCRAGRSAVDYVQRLSTRTSCRGTARRAG